jgi:hypothetical protein
MTNATAHGLDTNVMFKKGLLTTKTRCADMTQTFQAAGRMNRANNLKIIALDVKLGSTDSIARPPMSLSACRDAISRDIRTQQVTKSKRQVEGHAVAYKPLQHHEGYVREINAWLMHLQELSDYSHECEFRRQAAFYHAKVTDSRDKSVKKNKVTPLEIVNKIPTTQYDDQQLGLWGDGTRTNISCQYMSSVVFLGTLPVFRDPPQPVQATLAWSSESGELDLQRHRPPPVAAVQPHDPRFIERSTYTIVKDVSLSARAAEMVLPLIEHAVQQVSDELRDEENVRKKKKKKKKKEKEEDANAKQQRVTYPIDDFKTATYVLREYEGQQQDGGGITIALARALFQFCIRDEFRASVREESREAVCQALYTISALILDHHEHVTCAISLGDHAQKMFGTLLSCGFEETFGKTVENAREFYTMDTMNHSLVNVGKMFSPPVLPSYCVFKKMSSDVLFLRQINVRSLLTAFGDNECHRNAHDCLQFRSMIVPKAEQRVRGDSDGNTWVQEYQTEPLSKFMQAVDNTGDEQNYAQITSHFINLLRLLSGEHDVHGMPITKDSSAPATTTTMSLIHGGPIADYYNDTLCALWSKVKDKEEDLFVKRLKYFAWHLKVGSLNTGVGKTCTVAHVASY